jgi:hypothetical protein
MAMPVATPGRSGKPLDKRAHGRDVADAQPDAAHEAVAEIYQPDVVQMDAERGNEKNRH